MTDINTPTGGDDKLKSILESLPEEQKQELLKVLNENEELKQKNKDLEESLTWNKRAEWLGIYHAHNKYRCWGDRIKIKENKNFMGYKGKEYTITLPFIDKEKKYKHMHFFISDDYIDFSEYNKSPDLIKQSYSEEDFIEILNFINDSFNDRARGTFGKFPRITTPSGKQWGRLGFLFKGLTGLDKHYYLKDRCKILNLSSIVSVSKYDSKPPFRAKLFLKLPD